MYFFFCFPIAVLGDKKKKQLTVTRMGSYLIIQLYNGCIFSAGTPMPLFWKRAALLFEEVGCTNEQPSNMHSYVVMHSGVNGRWGQKLSVTLHTLKLPNTNTGSYTLEPTSTRGKHSLTNDTNLSLWGTWHLNLNWMRSISSFP